MSWNQHRQCGENEFHSDYNVIRMQTEGRDTSEAIVLLENFIRENPNHAEAHNDLAVLYYRADNKLQALGHHEKAVRLSQDNITFRKNLASFYFVEMGWVDDAILIYTDILKNHPADIETLSSLGIISSALGRNKEAVIFFKRVIELEPWNEDAHRALETVISTDKQVLPSPVVESAACAKPQNTPDMQDFLAGLRETLIRLEDEAPVDSYEKSLKLVAEGKTDEAIAALERHIAGNPHDALAHNDLGVLYTRSGNMDESIKHHEFAVSNGPGNPTFRKNLASVYYASAGRTDDAILIYADLLKESPNDVETLEALAIISADNNRPEEACIFLRKLLEIDPSNQNAAALLSKLEPGKGEGFFLAAR
jgi:Flp pilus assembly protein TadD